MAVDVQGLANRTDLVGKRHFQCMETVTGVLEHLGDFKTRLFDRRSNVGIEPCHGVPSSWSRASNSGEGRIVKIVNGTPLAEKFRVKTDIEIAMKRLLGRLS